MLFQSIRHGWDDNSTPDRGELIQHCMDKHHDLLKELADD
jgi:hypothetical protein